MSKFLVKKRLNLDFLGDDWKDCYIELVPYGPEDLKRALEAPDHSDDRKGAVENLNEKITTLERSFVGGKGYTADGIAEIKAADLKYLPLEVFNRATDILLGTVDPNSQAPSIP